MTDPARRRRPMERIGDLLPDTARRLGLEDELRLALAGLRQWGDRYLSEQPPRLLRRKSDGVPVVAALVPEGAREIVAPDEVESVPGPGAAS